MNRSKSESCDGRLTCAVILLSCLVACETWAEDPVSEPTPDNESRLLSEVRQLTFAGRRAGEGYFSRDGSEMVFQSERLSENPFFQIYVMDRETGDIERISPGHGKTTCAWIHPEGNQILFASTHADPAARDKQKSELSDRAEGKEKRYSWDYDDSYDLYVFDRKTKTNRKLASAKGYDAEAVSYTHLTLPTICSV